MCGVWPLHRVVPGRYRHHRGGRCNPRHRRDGRTYCRSDRRRPMRKDMADLITEHGMLARLAPESIELISRCARNVAFDPGERLLEEGRPATTFFLIHRGHVALEIHQAGRGALVIETIGPKGTVGWSWL